MLYLVMMIVWLVAFFVMMRIESSVGYRKKDESNGRRKTFLSKLPSGVIMIVVIALVLGAGFFLIMSLAGNYQEKEEDKQAKIQSIEAEYEALHEDNVDPETGKTILTENFLNKEYRLFYLTVEGEGKSIRTIGIVGLLVIVGMFSLDVIPYCIGAFFKKSRPTLPAVIYLLVITGLLVGGIFAFDMAYSYRLPPDPDSVTFEVYQVKAARYRSESTDDEGNTTSSYWAGIDFGDGEIRYKGEKGEYLYRSIGEDGQYFLARAKGKLRNYDFKCYPVDRFMPDNHL